MTKQKLGKFQRLLSFFKLPIWYAKIAKSQLFINFVVQRIFRINSELPFLVHYTSKIQCNYKDLHISESAKISLCVSGGCYVTVFPGTKLHIGENTIIAPNVAIQTGNHDLQNRNKYVIGNILIGDNCWVGYGAVILKGVELGNNVTVAANAVVNKSFPDNCVIGGVPAIIIKQA